MSLSQLLVNLASLGTSWVLWLLLALSVLSLQIILERAYFFWKRRIDTDALAKQIRHLLRHGEMAKARALVARSPAPECLVLAAGLHDADRGARAAAETMLAAQTRERLRMEGSLNLLAIVAGNAPIIGLIGSVLGAVAAFQNMAVPFAEQRLTQIAADGFSEAFLATAAGLLVAAPANIAHHLLQKRVQSTLARAGALMHLILAEIQATEFTSIAVRREKAA